MKNILVIGKILAAVTIAVGIATAAHVVADVTISPAVPASPAPQARLAAATVPTAPTKSASPSVPQAPAVPSTAAPVPDFAAMLASANPDAGKAYAKTCAACHSFDKGGASKVGPNLYGIVASKHAHAADFKYSDAMKALSGKTWTFEALNEYLRNPKAAIPNNRMAFAGVKNDKDRANLIAWLRTLSEKPEPLPKPEK